MKESNSGGICEKPVTIFVASLAISFLMDLVSPFAVVELTFWGHLAGEDLEVVYPPLGLGVEAGARGIVDDFFWDGLGGDGLRWGRC